MSRRAALAALGAAGAATVLPAATARAEQGQAARPVRLPEPGRRQVGFVLAHEQFPGGTLVANALAAQAAGFDGVWTSDHVQPWLDVQGHSTFPWDTLTRIGARSDGLFFGPGVCCPTYRHRPVEVAHAFATMAISNPGQVFLAVGTGEALNEKAATGEFGPYAERAARLVEAVRLIRRLWTGEKTSFEGRYYKTVQFRLWDVPDVPPPVYIAASGPKSAYLAGFHGDGWVCSPTDFRTPEFRAQFRRGARDAGKDPDALPVLVEQFVSVGGQEVTEAAARLWRFTADPWAPDLLYDPDPESIRRSAQRFPLPQVYGGWARGTDPGPHIEALAKLLDDGATPFVHSGQPDQQRVIDFYGRRVLPALA